MSLTSSQDPIIDLPGCGICARPCYLLSPSLSSGCSPSYLLSPLCACFAPVALCSIFLCVLSFSSSIRLVPLLLHKESTHTASRVNNCRKNRFGKVTLCSSWKTLEFVKISALMLPGATYLADRHLYIT